MAKLSRGLAFVELVNFVFLLTIVENPGPCMSWWVKPRDPIQSLFPMAFDVHLTIGLLIGSSNQGNKHSTWVMVMGIYGVRNQKHLVVN